MCCYEGTFLTEEDAEILQNIAEREASFFTSIGFDLPEQVIIDYPHYQKHEMSTHEWQGVLEHKATAVKPVKFSSFLDSFPEHFDDTACVFLTDLGQCGLQILAEAKGLHPWYYKPFVCWLHPIAITPLTDNNVLIQLPNSKNDPHRWGNFLGYTPYTFCGTTRPRGEAAFMILKKELKFLGEIVDRDFEKEIKQNCTEEQRN
ncbi:MAG: hypothetical protein AB4290_30000 [Spirulina sp.]